ncbi:MAG: serine/threonine-protein kinase [Chloroflexota bacterium]
MSPDNAENTNQEEQTQLQNGATLVQRYVIQDVIGVGGMGSVYRARDLHFPNVVKLVAIKEMINRAPDPLVSEAIIKNFEREANILATLNHVSIPRIYDYFSEANRSYLVLEFINGKDLEAIITQSEGFISEEQAITWGIELCEVLSYLHNHKPEPIIFRDIKPSNIMINQENHIILVDFGIAKSFQSGQKGTMIGTEGYSPPEQYRGEANHSADIYALGATLHHLLTRRDPRMEPPFSFGERPIRKTNPAISLELEAVINVALHYDPPGRFENIDAMKEALVAAAIKTGLLGRIYQSATTIQTSTLKPLWTFQCEDEIRGTPLYYDGGIYLGSCDNNIYSLNATDGEFVWKYATGGSIVSRPAIFDGNIFIGSEDQSLHVINVRTGKINWSYLSSGHILSSPRISDGHVFFGSDDNSLHAVNVLTGRVTWKFDAGSPIRSSPYIIDETIYVGSESGEFYAIDFRGELKWRFKAKLAITSSPVVHDGIVYFGSLDSSFYALETKGGWIVWRFRMGKGSIVSPCFAENLIFTGSADGLIYAIEARTSKVIWQFQADHQISGSPVIYKDSIYCGAANGIIYCLEYRTGRLRWMFETQGSITSAPVLFDDIVYIGSTDHRIYALIA